MPWLHKPKRKKERRTAAMLARIDLNYPRNCNGFRLCHGRLMHLLCSSLYLRGNMTMWLVCPFMPCLIQLIIGVSTINHWAMKRYLRVSYLIEIHFAIVRFCSAINWRLLSPSLSSFSTFRDKPDTIRPLLVSNIEFLLKSAEVWIHLRIANVFRGGFTRRSFKNKVTFRQCCMTCM